MGGAALAMLLVIRLRSNRPDANVKETVGGKTTPSSYAHAHDLTVAQVKRNEEQETGDSFFINET